MLARQTHFLHDKSYLSTAASYFFVDVLNSGRVLLVALIAVSLGLSNAQVGIFLLLYNTGGSVSQPIFGWLAHRFGARWLIVGGTGWVISFYVLAAILPEWPALLALTGASLGSAAFHPRGTKVVSQISDSRRTQATALRGTAILPLIAAGATLFLPRRWDGTTAPGEPRRATAD